jgi:hypothetical protein
MTMFIQPAGQLHNADRRHPVGENRKIRLAGYKVETCRVYKCDAHYLILEGSS